MGSYPWVWFISKNTKELQAPVSTNHFWYVLQTEKKKYLLEYIISSSPVYAKLGFELKGLFSLYRDVSRDVEITDARHWEKQKLAKTEGPSAVVRLFPTPQSVFSWCHSSRCAGMWWAALTSVHIDCLWALSLVGYSGVCRSRKDPWLFLSLPSTYLIYT